MYKNKLHSHCRHTPLSLLNLTQTSLHCLCCCHQPSHSHCHMVPPSWPVRIVAHHNLRHTPTTCACIISDMCFILIELQYIYIYNLYTYIFIHLSSSFYMDTTHPPDLFIRPSTNTSIGFQHFPAAYLWNSLDSHSSKTTVERGEFITSCIGPYLQKCSIHDGYGWIFMDMNAL